MRLFLIRHGQVIPPAPGAFYGGADVPLSEEGKREAQAAARFLAPLAIDHIIASPLSRAKYGAEQVQAVHSYIDTIVFFDQLREIDRGRWYGLSPEAIEQQYPGDLAAHAADPHQWRDHGGESLGDLQQRVLSVRDQLLSRYAGKTIVLVSHLHPTRAILAATQGLSLAQWPSLQIPTASVSLIDYSQSAQGRLCWTGHKPDGLDVLGVFPQYFRKEY